MSKYQIPYVETQALIAVMDDDLPEALRIASDMLPGERRTFCDQLATLTKIVESVRPVAETPAAGRPRPRIRTTADASKIFTEIEHIVRRLYPLGVRLDIHRVLDELERHGYDMGTDMDAPAVRKVRAIANEVRKGMK